MQATLLKQIPLFSSLSDQQLARLLAHSQQRRYGRSSCVVYEGQQTDTFYVILSGRVKVSMHDEDGKEIILAKLGASEFFGEMGLFDQRARSASVETLEICEILRFSHAGFMACFKDNADLSSVIICKLVDRLRAANRKIGSLALLDVAGRVARYFLDHAQERDGEWVVPSVSSNVEIARMVGASREMVSRVVSELRESACIRYEKRTAFLLGRLKLEAIAQVRKSSVADHGARFVQRPRKRIPIVSSIN
jgi:CRP/FNR family cyclic AMP-dependent transcriptional regulator